MSSCASLKAVWVPHESMCVLVVSCAWSEQTLQARRMYTLRQPSRIQQVALLSWKPSFWILLGPLACPRMQLKVCFFMPSSWAMCLLRADPCCYMLRYFRGEKSHFKQWHKLHICVLVPA